MATLTRKQRASVARALHSATWARDYIMRDDVAVGRLTAHPGTSLTYTRTLTPEQAEVLREPVGFQGFDAMIKGVGSPLAGLFTAISEIESMLNLDDEVKRQKAIAS